ncbi:hypothetical protein KUH03_09170 [Sphingobacterium sp. E70]|nr:hypothetical protein KUH03_09170 [Sphingobacterium sp. E70]
MSAFESYHSFQGWSNVKTWLMAILKNKVAEFYRKKYRHTGNIPLDHYFDSEGSWKHDDILQDWNEKDDNLLDNSDFNSVMAECMDKLPLKWLIPVKLYYLEEKKRLAYVRKLALRQLIYGKSSNEVVCNFGSAWNLTGLISHDFVSNDKTTYSYIGDALQTSNTAYRTAKCW